MAVLPSIPPLAARPGDHKRGRRRSAPAVLAVGLGLAGAALLLAGCTTGADGGQEAAPADSAGTTGTSETAAELAFANPDADDFNRALASEEGLVDLQPVQILDVETGDASTLVVSFEMASHHCHGIQATVAETDTEVILDLHTGRRPGVAPAACAYGVYPYTTAVELASPLGDRALATATDRTATPAAGADETTTAVAASGPLDPAQVDPVDVAPDEVDRYLGRHVEDGVEWALANDRLWRILSFDGVATSDDSPDDPERLSFTVVADVIVAYEWS